MPRRERTTSNDWGEDRTNGPTTTYARPQIAAGGSPAGLLEVRRAASSDVLVPVLHPFGAVFGEAGPVERHDAEVERRHPSGEAVGGHIGAGGDAVEAPRLVDQRVLRRDELVEGLGRLAFRRALDDGGGVHQHGRARSRDEVAEGVAVLVALERDVGHVPERHVALATGELEVELNRVGRVAGRVLVEP